MKNVPLCATDDGHHRENHPDGKAKVHVKDHYREPGHHPNYLQRGTEDTIQYLTKSKEHESVKMKINANQMLSIKM